MTAKGSGLLAIWSTVAGEIETDYLHWLTREHVFERVGIPGFRSGRVFQRRRSAPSEYLILYELADAGVMGSEHYQERLNHPTEWTKRVMPTLERFRRGGGEVVKQSGTAGAFGSKLSVVRFEDVIPDEMVSDRSAEKWASLSSRDRIVNSYLMQVSADGTGIATREKSMRRGGEGNFTGVFMIEAMDDAALDTGIENASADMAVGQGSFERYDLLFSFVKSQS